MPNFIQLINHWTFEENWMWPIVKKICLCQNLGCLTDTTNAESAGARSRRSSSFAGAFGALKMKHFVLLKLAIYYMRTLQILGKCILSEDANKKNIKEIVYCQSNTLHSWEFWLGLTSTTSNQVIWVQLPHE